MAITWFPLHKASSQFARIGHDSQTGHGVVEFHNGGRYGYPNMTPEHAKAIAGAESAGSAFIKFKKTEHHKDYYKIAKEESQPQHGEGDLGPETR